MKTLSVKQPYASFICHGIKTVENRTWSTDYRGKILIHASGSAYSMFSEKHVSQKFMNELCDCLDIDEWNCPNSASLYMQNTYRMLADLHRFYGITRDDPRPMNEWMKQAVKDRGYFFRAKSIIGEAELVDIVKDSEDDFATPGNYHWILANPKAYEKPIMNVVGRLRLWEFDIV